MAGNRVLGIVAALLLIVGPSLDRLNSLVAAAPDEIKSRDQEESEETARLCAAELPNWTYRTKTDRKANLQLEPRSVLRWTNPDIGRVNGEVFLWTANGRPEVVVSLIKSWEPDVGFLAEMQSLSLESLEGNRDEKRMWEPTKPGIELQDVPGAPAPADSPARRLLQLRSLAGEFSAELIDHRRESSGLHKPLRLLTQPLYRYQSQSDEVVDGALFAFVLGTDPEVFLLLEARKFAEGPRWQFGFARMNPDSISVRHRDKEAWNIGRVERLDAIQEPYVLLHVPESSR